MEEYRTHSCNEISLEDVGKKSKNRRMGRNNKRLWRTCIFRY